MGKAIPVQARRVPGIEASRFPYNWHMKVVRMSSLHTCHLYPPRKMADTHLPAKASTPGPQCSQKDKSMKYKPATSQLVVQCLNQLCHRLLHILHKYIIMSMILTNYSE
jgi:hypothetical protein